MSDPRENKAAVDATSKDDCKDTVAPQAEDKRTYPFQDHHTAAWTRVVSLPEDTPIGRAWARLLDRGINVGSPSGDVYKLNDKFECQEFDHATAFIEMDLDRNPNLLVDFKDARGNVGHESGL